MSEAARPRRAWLSWVLGVWLCVTGLLSGLWIYGRGDGLEIGGPLPPAQRLRLQQWQNLRDQQLSHLPTVRLVSVSATLFLGVVWLGLAFLRSVRSGGLRFWIVSLAVPTVLLSGMVLGFQYLKIDPLVVDFVGDRRTPWDALESTWAMERVSTYVAYLGVGWGAIAAGIWGE